MSGSDHEVNDNDVAIIGMAIRVPGADTPEAFWENLKSGQEMVKEYSEDELLAKGVSRSLLANPNYVRAGIPLDGIDQFDPEFFGFSQQEAGIIDPQHRHFYEAAWEAIERSGHPPNRFDGAIGVFAGCGMGAYFTYNLLTNPELLENVGTFLLRHTGNDKDFLSTRVSYLFDLKGPSVNIQTACSTSLVATHVAVQSLLSGECDIALAGGSTIEVPHGIGYLYKEGEVLSPDGHCRPFDHRSKGTVFGSGCGVVVLRRLADALEDGDHIHAIIKGSAVNNDGSSKVGYLAPSVAGQAAAIAEALAVADVSADTIGYVECHGTATPVGDPIEVTALTGAFRESTDRVGYCRIGSVKSNIGHLDTAAGVASLIKAALALENRQIPPSLNYEEPNPNIEFADGPFKVAAELADWPSSTPRRACVNSLGVGGTNAFVVLEEAPRKAVEAANGSPQFLTLSARNRKALDAGAERLVQWLRRNPDSSLESISFTLAEGRKAFEHRRVLACSSVAEAADVLESNDPRRVFNISSGIHKPRVVFMYPGGGAQYFAMGRGLYRDEPIFREYMDRGLALLSSEHEADLSGVFHAPDGEKEAVTLLLDQPSVQLPLTFLIEYALTQLWSHYGVKPDILIGHSMGENTAACVAGVTSFEEALGILRLRGQLVEQAPPGGVLSVPMPAEELRPYLGEALDLASVNSAQLSVASGRPELLDDLARKLSADGVDSQRVKVNVAAHSRLFDGILRPFGDHIRSISLHTPNIPIISNRTGQVLTDEEATDPEYWVRHLRNTVMFGAGIDFLSKQDDLIFLEVGPGNMLGSFARQNTGVQAQHVVASMRHPNDPTDDSVYMRSAMGRLHALGYEFEEASVWPERRRIPLPTYAFQHGRYWFEPGKGQAIDLEDALRPLKLVNERDWFIEPGWVQQGIREFDECSRNWLVFHGRDGISAECIRRLRESGNTVVEVHDGDVFSKRDKLSYSIAPEAGGDGYAQLISALAEDDLLPDRILHTWLLTFDRKHRPGSTFFHRIQNQGFYSLFYLARAMGKSGLEDHPCHLVVAANGSQSVKGEGLKYPTKATALGPCQVIPREFPNISCSFVDLNVDDVSLEKQPAQSASAVDGLYQEMVAKPDNQIVVWRRDVRWQRHFRPCRPTAEEEIKIRKKGVYLLTGGLGGIATVVGRWLAERYSAKLVLLGRTPLPDRSQWTQWLDHHGSDDPISQSIEKLESLESYGAEVHYVQADVTVEEQVQDALASANARFGQINGVFHIAGAIADSLIQLKTTREIEEVFAAKLYGTVVLDQVFGNQSLDFMALFGSTSAFIAPQGQVDYVAANSFINAQAAHCLNQRPYPVIALNWGIWSDVGMVAHQNDSRSANAAPESGYRSFREGTEEIHEVVTVLDAKSDWVVDEHRLATGEALLPGTGYFELIQKALTESLGSRPFRVEQLVFQTGLFVENDEPRYVGVRLKGRGQDWTVEVLGWTSEGWQTCATGNVVTTSPIRPEPLDIGDIARRCDVAHQSSAGSGAIRTRQEDHLQFGPRWRVLRRLDLGKGEALASIRLQDEYLSDLDSHPIHPALLDIGTGCAMDLIPGYANQAVAEHLWVPMSYGSFTPYAPFERSMWCWIRYRGEAEPSRYASFDVMITSESGEIIAQVEALTLSRLEGQFARMPGARLVETPTEAGRLSGSTGTPGEIALRHNVTQGITKDSGVRCLEAALASGLSSQLIISSLSMSDLLKQADTLSRSSTVKTTATFERPDLDSEFEPPRDRIEQDLAELWAKLLGVDGVGIHDSFFDLGGHSLIAVRLFNEIANRFGDDLPMSVLMQSPTICDLAEMIRGAPYDPVTGADTASKAKASKGPTFNYVVPMNTGMVGSSTPLFMVAGMFGNVLNLSHLAQLLGEDRPFYALQARGLFGDMEPHESFEEMASAYIDELRQVQPTGPYLLGGFSGGGLVAFEMARQLIESGEHVLPIVMLDTPVRDQVILSLSDKITMAIQDMRRVGPRYFLDKIRERNEWRKRSESLTAQALAESQLDEANFRSQTIGDAFVRALRKYQVPELDVDVCLFRPKQHIKYHLSGGRLMDKDREYVSEDNGWTPFVRSLEVNVVPGDHDSMVLEPNVRVLVGSIKSALRRIESEGDSDTAQAA